MDVELDGQALYQVIDEARWDRRLRWKQVVEQTGISQRVLGRLRNGESLHASNLVKVLAWLGSYDMTPFIRKATAV